MLSNGTVSTKMYDKRNDLDFGIVNIPFRCRPAYSYEVYISQVIIFARDSSNRSDINCCNVAPTAKLLRQDNRYFKLLESFSNFIADTVPWTKNIASV